MQTGLRSNFSTHRAKQVAKADSGTWGPQTGRSPLHLVFAFCRAALSHSSRPRASLHWESKSHPGKLEGCKFLSKKSSKNWQFHSFFKLRSSLFSVQAWTLFGILKQTTAAHLQSDQLTSKPILSYKVKCHAHKPPWKITSTTTTQLVIRTYLTAARWQS